MALATKGTKVRSKPSRSRKAARGASRQLHQPVDVRLDVGPGVRGGGHAAHHVLGDGPAHRGRGAARSSSAPARAPPGAPGGGRGRAAPRAGRRGGRAGAGGAGFLAALLQVGEHVLLAHAARRCRCPRMRARSTPCSRARRRTRGEVRGRAPGRPAGPARRPSLRAPSGVARRRGRGRGAGARGRRRGASGARSGRRRGR